MAEPVTVDIDNGGTALLFAGHETDKIAVLAFHGGGGVAGEPEMLTAFADQIMTDGGLAVIAPSYRTLKRDAAVFEDMRSDAANALAWATSQLPDDGQLYLLGASFGGLLALDALVEAHSDVQARVTGLILLNAVTDVCAEKGWSNRVVPAPDFGHLSPYTRLKDHPMLNTLRCYMAHGGKDDVVSIDASRKFVALWPAENVTLDEFPNSGHGFFNRTPHCTSVANAVRRFMSLSVSTAPVKASKPATVQKQQSSSLLPASATIVYGIGAQKAGTSWLFEQLSKSVDCHTAPTKELHYFDAMYVKGEDSHLKSRFEHLARVVTELSHSVDPHNQKRLRNVQKLAERLNIHATERHDHRPYAQYMQKGYDGQKIICDFTPSYCTLNTDGFKQMDSVGPAKFIFILRDPVARLWSQIRMAVSAAHPQLTDDEYEARCVARARDLCANRTLATIPRANYSRTMTALEGAVPANNIHYVFYEDLFSQTSVDKICKFLDLAPLPIQANTKVNLGRTSTLPEDIAHQMAQGLAPQYEAVRKRFGAAVPASWRADDTNSGVATMGGETAQKLPFLSKLSSKAKQTKKAPVIVFPHIPKTAGQTVVRELLRILPRESFSTVKTHADAPPDAQMPAGYRLYAGHIDWVDLETLPEDRFAFTILRNPRERIASFYFYLLREADKLSAEELATKERTNMRMISTRSADDYFFGGDKAWQHFIQDHYNNFYCNYIITRRIRGWKEVSTLDATTLVNHAVEGASALQKIYTHNSFDALEADIHDVLGTKIRMQGNYFNAGPQAETAQRWNELLEQFEHAESAARLEQFVAADFALMKRLNLHI